MFRVLITFLTILLATSLAQAEQRYFYDSLGRLTAEIDLAGNVAFYEYDAVGNLLAIRRGDPEQLSLFSFTPTKGPVGTTVTILGSGFSATLSENQVFVNDTPATVLSAENASIVFTVPSAATTGLIKVTTPRGTVQSQRPFIVIDTPVITGIEPGQVAQGTVSVATIYGNNLPSSAEVTFSHPSILGQIVHQGGGAQLSMRVTVASNTPVGLYPFSFATPQGVIESGSVTLRVLPPSPAFNASRPVSVFVPFPSVVAPSGPVITSRPGPTIYLPSPEQIAPSGPAISATPGPTIFLPHPDAIAPSGSSMTVTPPESILMPE